MRVAIIGGGLAGTACAFVLKQYGAAPVIYEAGGSLARGASGNPLGLYNPRFSAKRIPESDFYTAAFSRAVRRFEVMEDIDWRKCGALHLISDEKKARRFPQTLENWQWEFEYMRHLSANDASEVAGVALNHEALYLPHSGVINPRKLCGQYARGVPVNLKTEVEHLSDIEADAIILCCGTGATVFEETMWLPLSQVRGQITQVAPTAETEKLKCNLCYGGYFTPSIQGAHVLGATFQRWLDHEEIIEEDDQENIASLGKFAPQLASGMEVSGHRASVRTTTKDHFPVVGSIPDKDNLYISAGHGSHGVLSTLMAAHLLADMLFDQPYCLPMATIARLAPVRFLQ